MSGLEIDVSERQSGRTSRMIAWLLAAPEGEHRVLVCHSHEEAMRQLRESRVERLGLESWQFVGPPPFGAGAWSGVVRGRGERVVLGVDNLDLLLPGMFGCSVGRVSLEATT